MNHIRPIAVSTEKAAELVGCKNVRQFRREVKRGIWPAADITDSRPYRWSYAALEAALQIKSNRRTLDEKTASIDKALGMA